MKQEKHISSQTDSERNEALRRSIVKRIEKLTSGGKQAFKERMHQFPTTKPDPDDPGFTLG